MISTTADSSPWGLCCASPLSAEEASSSLPLPDDWLSFVDFCSPLPAPAPSTQADLAELLDLDDAGSFDISDLFLPEEIRPSFNPSSGISSIFEPYGVAHQSDGFSSLIGADGAAHQSEPALMFEVDTPPLHTNSSTMSSPHNSDAGSSIAVGEGAFLIAEGLAKASENHVPILNNPVTCSATSSRKRQHEELGGSDLEGCDREEGKSHLDPSDRKQQRLLRNRELAFESRQRKKSYVSDLEAKCKMLEHERNQLQQQICFSTAENAVLKSELSHMKKMKGRDGVAEPAVLFEDSLPLEFLSLLICLFLLMLRLSLCVSPSLALVLRAILFLPSFIKAGGLLKEQVDSKKCSRFSINTMRRFEHFWLDTPFMVCGLFMAWLNLQVLFSSLEHSFCKSLRGSISYNMPFR